MSKVSLHGHLLKAHRQHLRLDGVACQGSRFSVQGSGFTVQSSWFRIQGSEIRVQC